MQTFSHDNLTFHLQVDGPVDGPAVVFANSLGTDLRIWDAVIPQLPAGARYIRFDKRGHGLSDASDGPYDMDMLAGDAGALMDAFGLRPAVFVGLSIGGQIAQRLAAMRSDLIAALVLMDTAAKMGTAEMWQARMATIRAEGMQAISDTTMERWFHQDFRDSPELPLWRNMLERTSVAGYLGCCAALAQADLTDQTARLTLPTIGIAGAADGASPPELVRETVASIAGSHMHVIDGAGHLPCVEKPAETARLITDFLQRIGYV